MSSSGALSAITALQVAAVLFACCSLSCRLTHCFVRAEKATFYTSQAMMSEAQRDLEVCLMSSRERSCAAVLSLPSGNRHRESVWVLPTCTARGCIRDPRVHSSHDTVGGSGLGLGHTSVALCPYLECRPAGTRAAGLGSLNTSQGSQSISITQETCPRFPGESVAEQRCALPPGQHLMSEEPP